MTLKTWKVDRSRILYLFATLAVMALGLISRRYQGNLPTIFGKYPGDALWTLMVFFGWGALLTISSTLRVAQLAVGTSFAVELFKLYQAPWIVSVRHSTLGHLVFGHTFSWQNLLAYALGAATGITFSTARAIPLECLSG